MTSRAEKDRVRLAVFTRDRVCQLHGLPGVGPCVGRLTFHHRRKAGAGGAYTEANGAALCVGHNDGLEDHPEWIELAPHLVVREGHPEWQELGRRAARYAK